MATEKYKALVVEDEVLLLESLVEKVQGAGLGFEVAATANNGRRALELLEGVLPDVVITDIRMPLMDGLALVKRINSEYVDVEKIIVSGYSEFEYAKQALRYNVRDYLLKPVAEEDLRSALLSVKLSIDQRRAETRQAMGIPPEQLSLGDAVRYIHEYIRENYRADIDLGELMADLHYTPDYIGRHFIREHGESPSKYQVRLRMNEAKNLLVNRSELSVRQVAEHVGYDDQSYFSRIFKKHTGLSPLDYRK